MQNAVDGLESALQSYIQDRQPIPAPTTKKRGERLVALPALAVAKIGLYIAMLEAGTRKADLARKLGLHPPQIDRLLDLRHSSKLELVQAALFALGRVVNISVSRYNAREAFASRHWP